MSFAETLVDLVSLIDLISAGKPLLYSGRGGDGDWVKAYLEWHFNMIKGEELQWINSYDAKARSTLNQELVPL